MLTWLSVRELRKVSPVFGIVEVERAAALPVGVTDDGFGVAWGAGTPPGGVGPEGPADTGWAGNGAAPVEAPGR